jgi:hypothetical protein
VSFGVRPSFTPSALARAALVRATQISSRSNSAKPPNGHAWTPACSVWRLDEMTCYNDN